MGETREQIDNFINKNITSNGLGNITGALLNTALLKINNLILPQHNHTIQEISSLEDTLNLKISRVEFENLKSLIEGLQNKIQVLETDNQDLKTRVKALEDLNITQA